MKNITLAMPEKLLKLSREYARKQGTTLNQMIRDLLEQRVNANNKSRTDTIKSVQGFIQVNTKDYNFNREELYER